jgi:hypothetical protein
MESLAISKRKPPSQRPERKMDATALAMAQTRAQDKADKAPATERSGSAGPPRMTLRGGKNGGHPMPGGPVPATSTKRPKKPG